LEDFEENTSNTHATNPSYILLQVKRFKGFIVEQVELALGGTVDLRRARLKAIPYRTLITIKEGKYKYKVNSII
jgi:hypothetical protein